MNILYLCDEYPPGRHGGIGTVVQLLARELVRQGHNVIVAGFYDWSYGGEDFFEDEGVKVYRFRRKLSSKVLINRDSLPVRVILALLKRSGLLNWDIRTSLVKYNAFLNDLIVKYSIDIVEMPDFHDYMLSCKEYVPFLQLKVPIVVKLHGSITYFSKEAGLTVPAHVYKMEKECLTNAMGVCSVSQYTADKTAAYFNYSGSIQVLYNGINDPNVVGVNKVRNQVIFTGSLAEKKGIYQLMKAWNIVSRRRPDAKLVVYGKGPISKLKSYLAQDSLKSVFFNGHIARQQLFEELSRSSVAVFPSYAECFALGPMEAMACGTAVIYTTRTSGPELISNEQNGILIDPDDIEGLAIQILRVLDDTALQTKLAVNGKTDVLKRFNMELIGQKHISYYNKIIRGARQNV